MKRSVALNLTAILAIVVLCFALGFFYLPMVSNARAGWLTGLSFVITVLGFGYTVYGLGQVLSDIFRRRRDSDRVAIRLRFGDSDVVLAYRPLRGEVSRAELMGILGMYAKDRFNPKVLDALPVLAAGKLADVLEARSDEIVVPINPSHPDAKDYFGHVREVNDRLLAAR